MSEKYYYKSIFNLVRAKSYLLDSKELKGNGMKLKFH